LYYSASFGLTDLVEHLMGPDVDLDAPGSRFGGSALHAAAWRGYIETAVALLEHGANPDRSDWDDVTPLHSAASCGNVNMVKLLLRHGASKDVVDRGGETPADWALKADQSMAFRILAGEEDAESGTRQDGGPAQLASSAGEGVWTYPRCYFPDWYDRRSGVESSSIIRVELGSEVWETVV
jgi:hypothetical protein